MASTVAFFLLTLLAMGELTLGSSRGSAAGELSPPGSAAGGRLTTPGSAAAAAAAAGGGAGVELTTQGSAAAGGGAGVELTTPGSAAAAAGGSAGGERMPPGSAGGGAGRLATTPGSATGTTSQLMPASAGASATARAKAMLQQELALVDLGSCSDDCKDCLLDSFESCFDGWFCWKPWSLVSCFAEKLIIIKECLGAKR